MANGVCDYNRPYRSTSGALCQVLAYIFAGMVYNKVV